MTATRVRARLCSDRGNILDLPSERWFHAAGPAEHRLLERAHGPVLDIGCGPGRHVLALAERGIPTLGIDVTPAALALARGRGATVLERSVFDRIPGAGRWGTALLLDGNIGIGGDPVSLLMRVAELLRPDGRMLVELEAPGTRPSLERVRFEIDDEPGPWFTWARVGADALGAIAHRAGLGAARAWPDGTRWFGSVHR